MTDARTRDRAAALAELEGRLAERLGLRPGQLAVEADGRDGEIAVVRVPSGALESLLDPAVRSEIVQRARAAGFRHAALDLDLAGKPPGGGEA